MATYAGRYNKPLQDRYGNGYRNAKVAVETTSGDPVTLYANRAKGAYTPADGLEANEIKADSRGNLMFFADPGNYQIVVTPVGGSTQAPFPISVLPDPLEPDASEGALAAEQAARIAADEALISDLADEEAARIAAVSALANSVPHLVVGTTSADIQAYLNGLPAYVADSPLRRVVPIDGDWAVVAPLQLPSGVYLDLGQGVRLTLDPGVNSDVITNDDWVNGNTDIWVDGGFLDGNRTFQDEVVGDGPGQSLISLVNVTGFGLLNIRGKSPILHGIDCSVRDPHTNPLGDPGCSDGVVHNCRFTDYGDDGVTTHWSHGITVTACICSDGAATYSTSSNGFEVDDGSYDITLTGCVAHSHTSGSGFMVQGHAGRVPGRRITINGCVSYDNARAGYMVTQPTSAHVSEPARMVVINGPISSGNYYGIMVENYRSVHVINPMIDNVNHGVYINETIAGTVQNIVFRGGEMRNVAVTKVLLGGTATAAKIRVIDMMGVVFSEELWIDASQFYASSGTPVRALAGTAGRQVEGWALDPDSVEKVATIAALPGGWQTVLADIWWISPSGATDNAVFRMDRAALSSGAIIPSLSAGFTITSAGLAAAAISVAALTLNNTAVDNSKRYRFEVVRDATHASDTLATDAVFLGVLLRRAT